MNTYDIMNLLKNNKYPGRGIVTGLDNSSNIVTAYFIMGRSENSRNRIFVLDNNSLYTKAYDESKLKDPSLIIYRAIVPYKNYLIITNGDHTENILEGLKANKPIYESLSVRKFEEDYPSNTPRISSLIEKKDNTFTYTMSILKSYDGLAKQTGRYYYNYEPTKGIGHFIHTYDKDDNPLPTFSKEPEMISIDLGIDEFSTKLWNALDEDNKISLYVRYENLETKKVEERLFNKNEV
ncbi:inosine monophosphate cyclohydrolase [bacterium]|nr:inosine monophosphate cyclohydrolase [bacterium]